MFFLFCRSCLLCLACVLDLESAHSSLLTSSRTSGCPRPTPLRVSVPHPTPSCPRKAQILTSLSTRWTDHPHPRELRLRAWLRRPWVFSSPHSARLTSWRKRWRIKWRLRNRWGTGDHCWLLSVLAKVRKLSTFISDGVCAEASSWCHSEKAMGCVFFHGVFVWIAYPEPSCYCSAL